MLQVKNSHSHEENQPCKHNRSKKKEFRIPDLTQAQISDSRLQFSSMRERERKRREGRNEKKRKKRRENKGDERVKVVEECTRYPTGQFIKEQDESRMQFSRLLMISLLYFVYTFGRPHPHPHHLISTHLTPLSLVCLYTK